MSGNKIIPPRTGLVSVTAVTADTPTTAIEIGSTGHHLLICNEDFYVLFGDASVPAPDETATSGPTRCFLWPANTPMPVFLTGKNDSHVRVKPAGNGYLRMYKG